MILRKYATGSGANVSIAINKADLSGFATSSDWTPAAADVQLSIDGGSQANIATLPTFTNGDWIFTFSNAELTGKKISVRIVDSAPKAIEDTGFNIETYGHASAQIVGELDATISSRAPSSTALDNTVWTNAKAAFLTGDAFARLGLPAGASVSADIAAISTSGVTDAVTLAAIKLQTDKIGSTNIIALERVISGKMTLVKGEGRSFTFTEPSGSGWPSDLTGYTITFTADKEPLNVNTGDDTTGPITCSVSPATGTGRVITLPMTVAISDSMKVSRPGVPSYNFNIWAVNGSLQQEALVLGTVDVKDNVRL